jgi:hypothetical protein
MEIRPRHGQEVWLVRNRAEIETKIDQGYAAAQRGELIDADAARSKLKNLKQARC